jgi:DNA-binding NtrC family response regulator
MHPKAVTILSQCSFPGNVRELKNLVERLVTFTDADTIKPEDLPPEILRTVYLFDNEGLAYNEAKRKVVDEFNRAIIFSSLLKHNGNVTKAAIELKLDRANFKRLMRKYHTSLKEIKQISAPD